MSYREEFLGKLKEFVLEARVLNSDVIDLMPINVVRAEYLKIPHCRMLPDKNTLSEEEYREIIATGLKIGNDCAMKLVAEFQERIVVNAKGHNMMADDMTFIEVARKYDFSLEKIGRALSMDFARVICNIPKDASVLDVQGVIDKVAYFLDPETDFFQIYGENTNFTCSECGDELRFQLNLDSLRIELVHTSDGYEIIDGKHIFKNKNPNQCEYRDGLKEYTVEVDVNSGKLVMANNVTAVLPKGVREKRHSYMSDKMGRYSSIVESTKANVVHSQFYAEHGVIYLQGSNAHPRIFKNKTSGQITIKNEERYNEKTDTFDSNYTDDEQLVGGICMDLWASTGMDYDLFAKFCEDGGFLVDEMIEKLDATILDVKPGRYKATNYYFSSRHKEEGLFAEIEFVN